MRLKNKVALVPGASQGLGLAIARRFSLEGALVFLGDIKEDQGRAAAAEITSQGAQACFVRLDVADEESWTAALAALIDNAGKLDVLVNNAGINIRQPIEEMSVESLDMMLAVNVGHAKNSHGRTEFGPLCDPFSICKRKTRRGEIKDCSDFQNTSNRGFGIEEILFEIKISLIVIGVLRCHVFVKKLAQGAVLSFALYNLLDNLVGS